MQRLFVSNVIDLLLEKSMIHRLDLEPKRIPHHARLLLKQILKDSRSEGVEQ